MIGDNTKPAPEPWLTIAPDGTVTFGAAFAASLATALRPVLQEAARERKRSWLGNAAASPATPEWLARRFHEILGEQPYFGASRMILWEAQSPEYRAAVVATFTALLRELA